MLSRGNAYLNLAYKNFHSNNRTPIHTPTQSMGARGKTITAHKVIIWTPIQNMKAIGKCLTIRYNYTTIVSTKSVKVYHYEAGNQY